MEKGMISLSMRKKSYSYTSGFTTRESIYGSLDDALFVDTDLNGSWYNLVQEYSARTFTFFKDRLPAIAGLAKAFQSRFSKKRAYLAGLWYEDIIQGLAWERLPAREQNRKRDVFKRRAPSFSWASIDFPVNYSAHHFNQAEDAKALDFNVETKHQDPFGEVESAWVKIRANVKDLREVTKHEFILDDPNATEASIDPRAIVVHLCSSREPAHWTCSAGVSRGDETQYCLILVPCNDGSGSYERVGCLTRQFGWSAAQYEYTPDRQMPQSLYGWKEMDIVIA